MSEEEQQDENDLNLPKADDKAEKKRRLRELFTILGLIFIIGGLLSLLGYKISESDALVRESLVKAQHQCDIYNFTGLFGVTQSYTIFQSLRSNEIYVMNYTIDNGELHFICEDKATFCVDSLYLCFEGSLRSQVLNVTIDDKKVDTQNQLIQSARDEVEKAADDLVMAEPKICDESDDTCNP